MLFQLNGNPVSIWVLLHLHTYYTSWRNKSTQAQTQAQTQPLPPSYQMSLFPYTSYLLKLRRWENDSTSFLSGTGKTVRDWKSKLLPCWSLGNWIRQNSDQTESFTPPIPFLILLRKSQPSKQKNPKTEKNPPNTLSTWCGNWSYWTDKIHKWFPIIFIIVQNRPVCIWDRCTISSYCILIIIVSHCITITHKKTAFNVVEFS